MREYTTFAELWPYYLQEHSKAATRAWHYVGTSFAILTLITVIIFQEIGILTSRICMRLLFCLGESRRDRA